MSSGRVAFGLRPRPAGLLLIAAAATRALALLARPPAFPAGWGGEMPAVAWSLAQGLGFASPYLGDTGPTALTPPVYPFLLSGIFRRFGYSAASGLVALGANVLLSSLTVLPLYGLGARLFGRRYGLIAAWTWALYPLTGYTDAGFIWNTSLAVFLVTTFLALTLQLDGASARPRWMAYGGLTGLLVLTEPVSLAVIVPATAWLLVAPVNHRRLAAALLVAAILPAAWLARNYARFDRFVFLRSGFGLELSVGVRQDEFRDDRPLSLPNRDSEELARYAALGEVAYVKQSQAEAVQWILAHPGSYLGRVARRIVGFWTGWRQVKRIYLGHERLVALKTLLYSLPALGSLVGLFGMARERRREAWLLAAILALYPVVYYLTHILPRYRLPLEPLMLCLTGYALLGMVGPMVRRAAVPHPARG